ncbi:MAG TPA: chloride channel protein [Vicinamibacterales bacterium]|nr:chloride channel protein [Vicinamibacterales bacterium]
MKPSKPLSSYSLQLRESHLFVAVTIVVGILAGLSAVLFAVTIDLLNRLFFGVDPSTMRLIAMPALVSVVTGLLMRHVFHGIRGSGIPQTKAAYHLNGGIVSPLVPVGKFLAGTLAIGSGHSLGREGPSVQIGAGLASAIGQWLRLPPERVKDLLPVGAAGALAAAFNTPVAAVIFALEEIIGDMNATLLGSTVVASVASVVVARSVLGNEPLFRVPAYHLVHPAELLAYAALGMVGGCVSIVFCKALLGLRGWFRRLPERTVVWQPAMGGLAAGLILVAAPQLLGTGYDYVDRALNGGVLLQMALALGLMKIVATVISYASGNPGGIFAPTLYIGAMTGAVVGTIVSRLAPFAVAEPGAYALVGMGAVFAGIVRAPLTSVFMIFELTQDYQIIVPLMVANLLSFYLSRTFQPLPIYHALLAQDHVHLPSAVTRKADRSWTAWHVMETRVPFVGADATIADAVATLRGDPVRLVGRADAFQGTVTVTQLRDALADGRGTDRVDSLIKQPSIHAHPDHPLAVVVERLAHSDGVIPVVSRADAQVLLGVVTVEGIMRGLRGRTDGSRQQDGGPPAPTLQAGRQPGPEEA